MSTIILGTLERKNRYVVVKSADTITKKEDHRRGNLDKRAGDDVTWEAADDKNVTEFKVSFFNLIDGAGTWPFTKLKDGTPAPTNHAGPLVLVPKEIVTLQARPDTEVVKYEVEATPAPGINVIDKCDPMIIIRPVYSRLTIGVICAVLGALAGAALTLALVK